ncbi:hypothetical protein F511_10645 [Dorcoceras hygrometricum]|uniref:Uncharacterized protein n=1 Tax=Dorcoceras hygrometricum TaxID=472368 RepID=A0A2Z7CGX6_9LAMI|nr:hypothetical protein F511_10645 [Dorcoceras hygrometricum]
MESSSRTIGSAAALAGGGDGNDPSDGVFCVHLRRPLIEPIASVHPRLDAPDCIVSPMAWIVSFHNPSNGSDRDLSQFINASALSLPSHPALYPHRSHVTAQSSRVTRA